MLNEILFLVLGLSVLIAGGEFLVRGASGIASGFRIPPMVIGLTVVSFGTSAPELIISIQAALKGSPDIATGNVVGSNICNITLILGITALIKPVLVKRNTLIHDWPVALLSVLIFWWVIANQILGSFEGWLLVFALLIYVIFTILKPSGRSAIVKPSEKKSDLLSPGRLVRQVFFLILGIAGLYFGSEWFVESARSLALKSGLEERVVGLTIVALGTSLPELAASAISAFKSETDLALGNLLGSNIFNILSIMGITAIVTPIQISSSIIQNDMFWLLAATLLIFPLMLIRNDVSRFDGFLLLIFYAAYIMVVLW
ncbi:MAG: calcium/sodium antiporter [Cyclobacteriaceae bacterium]|nr:calcium/sodium antiporter [Cyclobacteriaceae bacterium]